MEENKEQEIEKENVDTDGEDVITDDDLLEGEDDPVTEEDEGDKKPEDTKAKKGQSREENSKFAKLRREKERLESENKRLKAEKDEAVFKGKTSQFSKDILEELGIDEIKNDKDLRLAEWYKEGEDNGEPNPTAYAYKKERELEEQNAKKALADEQEKANNKKIVDDDMRAFISKYGKEAFEEATNPDSDFAKLYEDVITRGMLTKLYGKYLEVHVKDVEQSKSKGVIPSLNGNSGQKETPQPQYESEEAFNKYWKEKYGG